MSTRMPRLAELDNELRCRLEGAIEESNAASKAMYASIRDSNHAKLHAEGVLNNLKTGVYLESANDYLKAATAINRDGGTTAQYLDALVSMRKCLQQVHSGVHSYIEALGVMEAFWRGIDQ